MLYTPCDHLRLRPFQRKQKTQKRAKAKKKLNLGRSSTLIMCTPMHIPYPACQMGPDSWSTNAAIKNKKKNESSESQQKNNGGAAMIRAFNIGDEECIMVPLPATRQRAPVLVLETGDKNLGELALLACKHPERATFDRIYAPYLYSTAPHLRFATVPLPDPFRFLGSGVAALNNRDEQDEELLCRINDLRSWGYVPSCTSSAIFAFVHFPLCFEYMLGWLGHLLVPKAGLVLYPRFGVPGVDASGWTNASYLRYLARDRYGDYPMRTRGIALEFLAMMARMTHSKLVVSKVLRKRRTVASVSGEQAWRNFDIGPFCAYAWRHQGHNFLPFPFAVTKLEDIPAYLTLEAQCRQVNKRLCF